MANSKYVPPLIAAGLGVSIMTYTFFGGGENAPELTGKSPGPKPESGLGQSAIDSKNGKGGATSQPSPPLQSGGAAPNKATDQTVAGTSASSRKGYSADHDVKLKDSKTGIHDGSDGGGVGVAEMRERKMKGQGLPSPQGGDTKAQVTPAAMNQGEGGNQPKPQNGRWWLGGW